MDDALVRYGRSILFSPARGLLQCGHSEVGQTSSSQRDLPRTNQVQQTERLDPEFPSRTIGKTFLCSGPNQFAGKIHLLFQRLVKDIPPDAYLVALNSVEHGMIRFRQPGWMSYGVMPISISMKGSRFEAMLLIGANDWIESDLGRWRVSANGDGLSLSGARDGRFS